MDNSSIEIDMMKEEPISMHPLSSGTVAVNPKTTAACAVTDTVSSLSATVTAGAQTIKEKTVLSVKAQESAFNNATTDIITKPNTATIATFATTDIVTSTITNMSPSTISSQSSCAALDTTCTIISTLMGIQSAKTATSTSFETSGKRKKKNQLWQDENAPKPPSPAYLLFLNDHREVVRLQNPGVHYNDLSRKLGVMWNELPTSKKQMYLDEAEKNKKKYMIELAEYHKSDAYKSFVERREKALAALKQEQPTSPVNFLICEPCKKTFETRHHYNEHVKSRRHQRNMFKPKTRVKTSKKSAGTTATKQNDRVAETRQPKVSAQGIPTSKSTVQVESFPDMSAVSEGDLNVPVFSEAFLHYNKSRESELRKLRKASTELEEQNAILSHHIDNLKTAIGKLEEEKTESLDDITRLEPFLKSFTECICQRFFQSGVLDGDAPVTASNIQDCLVKWCHPSCDNTLKVKLKTMLNELDYPM